MKEYSKTHSLLDVRALLTANLDESPYNFHYYILRAYSHERLDFPDLAAGDAYKALLLTDELLDGSGEYHQKVVEVTQALELRIQDDGKSWQMTVDDVEDEASLLRGLKRLGIGASSIEDDDSSQNGIARYYARKAYQLLARSLSSCGCLRSAYELSARGLGAFPHDLHLQQVQQQILKDYRKTQLRQDSKWDQSKFDPNNDLSDQGFARRELYPWNNHEPERFSHASLTFLNERLQDVAPKCEVRAVSLPCLSKENQRGPADNSNPATQQLGLFAIEDIAPHEIVLYETSLLTANNHLHGSLCDACSSALPAISTSNPELPSCSSCDDTFFCSDSCLNAAQVSYHPSVCGKSDFDVSAKDPSLAASANALYTLLLVRTIALSETQAIHPLELPETKYLWGDFTRVSDATLVNLFPNRVRQLPFSFQYNILAPIHLLEKMDIDIFASSSRYDIWILNTLFAKFRATASARLNTADGRPEVCAVHPMWCLANHSCAPNVWWEWGAEIKFHARGKSETERWNNVGNRERGTGIRKGEEILNHYCDVELDFKERREWAIGALGGICVCERCLWEEKHMRNGVNREKFS